MKISDLQLKLLELQDKHGDLEIFLNDIVNVDADIQVTDVDVVDITGSLVGCKWPDMKILRLT